MQASQMWLVLDPVQMKSWLYMFVNHDDQDVFYYTTTIVKTTTYHYQGYIYIVLQLMLISYSLCGHLNWTGLNLNNSLKCQLGPNMSRKWNVHKRKAIVI